MVLNLKYPPNYAPNSPGAPLIVGIFPEINNASNNLARIQKVKSRINVGQEINVV